jgi:peptide/nickel transport system substrate-binding protein
VVSCGRRPTATTTATAGTSTGRLTVGTTLKPRTLDPADAYELASSNVLSSLGDRLYTYKLGTDQLEPQLATALPKVTPDGKTYTIPLRQGVVFHDGTPFNAQAMAFSLERFIKNGGKPSSLLSDLVASVKASGDYELTIQLKNAFAPFPSVLTYSGLCAISPKAYQIGSNKFNPTKFVGTGPYKLVEFNPNSIRLDVFDKYWGQKPPNQGIDFQVLSTSANLFNAFRKGEVDLAYQSLDPEQIASLQKDSASGGWQVLEAKGNVVNYMVLNTKLEPLNKPEVRQAIASLINRPLIIERALRNQGEPAYSMIPNTFDVSKPTYQVYGDGNIAKAKELLTKAGFSKEKPLNLEVWYPSASTPRQQVSSVFREYVQQQLEGMVQIQPRSEESASFFANIRKGVYQSALVNWYPDFSDADNFIRPFLKCDKGSAATGCTQGGSQNQGSFYYSDRMNKLIEQQLSAQDPKIRQQVFTEIQELMAKDVPIIPLWQVKDYAFARNGLQNAQLDPIQQLPLWKISKG